MLINDNFMLQSKTAEELFHGFAKDLPVIDYHCHLSPKEIAEDHKFRNITELMLGGDHYKWRAMRTNGVSEDLITGNADDYDKFYAWAKTVPYLIGNPLYHWVHLELKKYFGITDVLTADNAREVWNKCNEMIAGDDFSAKQLITKSNVEAVCTTDDPADSLEYHKKIKADGFKTKVLPTFRPDKLVEISKPFFMPYIKENGLETYEDVTNFLVERIAYFNEAGCKLSDHGLEYVPYAEGDPKAAFEKAVSGKTLTKEEEDSYKTALIKLCAAEYTKYGWVMQIHIGALRNNNTRMFNILGADTGYDSINDLCIAEPLSRLLDSIERESGLPKTILYVLNPKDNYVIGTMLGNFQDGKIAGKIQFGSGWWFNDQRDGMESQMRALANLGMLSKFVGMLTDSRSFVSYPRHEYFRRIMCNLIGAWAEKGEYHNDMKMLGEIVSGISYYNAKNYFGF